MEQTAIEQQTPHRYEANATAARPSQTASGSNQVADQSIEARRNLSWLHFLQVAKPGILSSNLITVFGGFWIASGWDINWLLLFWAATGTVLIMAGGCALNNYLDRDLDVKMERTRHRVLPSGIMDPSIARIYGIVLGIAGFFVLAFFVNMWAALLGLTGFVVYVFVYTAWLKRSSIWSTVVGAISGAVPPVIGYVAVSQQLDAAALTLFMILFLWQPPHFWSLGIYRLQEYRAAGYRLLPVVKGIRITKIGMLLSVIPLLPVSILMYTLGYAGVIYLITAILLGVAWIIFCIHGFRSKDEIRWGRRSFLFSINYLTILFIVMILDSVKL